MKTTILLGARFSPWTEKARWALDSAAIPYRFVPHVALIGELGLRLRTGRLRGRVSTPVLMREDGRVLGDSFEIARHAGESPGGAELFPAENLATIADWNARSERALAAGRYLALQRSLRDPDALAASVPPWPFSVPALDRQLGAIGIRFVLRKYAAVCPAPEACETELRTALAELRTALAGRDYLLGSFSYADVTAAMMLAYVSPRPELLPGKHAPWRRALGSPELMHAFPDLLEWRDRIYARHRAPRAHSSAFAQGSAPSEASASHA